jgi:hypothetical protein
MQKEHGKNGHIYKNAYGRRQKNGGSFILTRHTLMETSMDVITENNSLTTRTF